MALARAHLSSPTGRSASWRDLASACQVSVSTMNHYFSSRGDLVAAIIRHAEQEGAPYLVMASTPSGDFSASIGDLVTMLSRGFEHGVLPLQVIGLAEGFADKQIGEAYLGHHLEPLLSAIAARLQAHMDAGDMRCTNARFAAIQLLSPLLVAHLHQAELGSRLSFREAGRVLDFFVPAARPHNHRTVANRLAKVAGQIEKWDAASPYRMSRSGGSAISVFIDGAYIRAVPGYQSRHFEITMGRVVSPGRQPRQFAAAPHVATGKHDAVRAAMRAQGWLPGHDVTVFSDGDVGLQGIVFSATRQPVTHIFDWFHLSMRLRHIEQTWQGLRHIGDLNIYLRDVAVDVPRLRHLLWSGYVREATRAVKNMLYQLEQHPQLRDANQKLRRLSVLISNLRTNLVQNTTSIVDYCHRYWSGQPISSSPAESAANSLVNARMNKKRQMRWSPAGAHRVLQVRSAVADGRLKQAKFALAT